MVTDRVVTPVFLSTETAMRLFKALAMPVSSGVRRKVQIPLSIKSALGIKSKYTSWAWLNGLGSP